MRTLQENTVSSEIFCHKKQIGYAANGANVNQQQFITTTKHVACAEEIRNTYTILVVKSPEKTS